MPDFDKCDGCGDCQLARCHELSDEEFAHREFLELQGDLYPEDDGE